GTALPAPVQELAADHLVEQRLARPLLEQGKLVPGWTTKAEPRAGSAEDFVTGIAQHDRRSRPAAGHEVELLDDLSVDERAAQLVPTGQRYLHAATSAF